MKYSPKSRAETERAQVYRPPQKLAMPTPHSSEIVFRWVRVSSRGIDDRNNWMSKGADGWTPVKASDYPEFMGPTREEDGSRFGGCIGTGDNVLMQCPKSMVDARNAYYAQQTENQMIGVDRDLMKQEDPRMPIFRERSSRNQTVGPRKVSFDD